MRKIEKSAPPPGAEPDEFVLSDGSIDRIGDVVDPAGWQLDMIKSPPKVLFNHDPDQILGNWEDIRKDAGGQLIGRINWAVSDHWPKLNYIRDLVRQGILRTVSVGFRPLERQPLTKTASKEYGPFRFTKSELLECSLVSIPANPNALAITKGLPRDLVAEIFKPRPATETLDRPRSDHGKPAARSLETKGVSTMSNATIAARIQAAQQDYNALKDTLAELSRQEDMTAEESRRYEELPGQIETARLEIEKHRNVERALLDGGEPINVPATVRRNDDRGDILSPIKGEVAGKPGETIRLPAAPRKHLEYSDHLFRALAAWGKAQASHDTQDLLRSLRELYPSGSGANEITGMVLRAAVNPANTTVATWAAELVQTDTKPFLDRLIADSIYLPLANMGVRYTFGNAGILKIPVRANSPTLAGNWVAEGAPKPVRRASFTTVSLAPTKLSVISTFTEEMQTYAAQSIEQIIRQAMSDDTSIALDTYLIDNVAASAGVRPAGLLNGVTPITASVLTPATAAMVADLKALIAAIVAAGGGRAIAIIINPAQALSLGFAQTTTGDFLFTDRAEAGSKFGVRFIVSATCPAGRVIAVDTADFATAQGDAPRFAVSTDATLHEEDTTPLALSATGSPNVVAAPMRSLFQTDAVAIRMSLYVSWVMRRAGMVQTIAAVTW
jgi:HK97 family phage prohead protease/HK97 family phage major capsid protein